MPKVVSFVLCSAALMGPAYAANWDYPVSPRGDVVDDYAGAKVPDPYRWLEDLDSPQTQAWNQAQNTLTYGFLEKLPQRERLRERLTQLWNYERFGLPFKEGGQYFYTRNSGLQNQSVLYVTPAFDHAQPRILLDPNTLAKDGTVALTAAAVSPDGKWLVYGTSGAGSDWNEYRVRAIATGEDTADHIQWIKFASPAWTKDSKGFFYSRYPAPKVEEGTGKTFSALEHQKLYYHVLGTPQADDRLVLEIPAEPKWFVRGSASEDGRFLVVTIARGSSSENLLRFADLGDPKAPRLDAPITPLVEQWEAEFDFVGSAGDTLYVITNLDAPRKRIVAIDAQAPARTNWRTVVPETTDTIESAGIVGGKLGVKTMRDATSRLLVFALDGKRQGEIGLPGIGSVAGLSGREDETELFFNFTSFTYPSTNFRHDLATGRTTVLHAPKVAFDPAAYETKQVFYTSKDGTRVPMFITHKKGLKPDGDTPTLLYGYGGFDISLTPAFSVFNLVWLEQGGVYAQPNLRGGGEYGKAWHDAGTKERKQNVFDDFIAAAEWLFANRYTRPEKLVLSGGSNGGLLVGAVINQRPDLCRVALPAVGVMDMLRFHKFTIGWAWASDYGSSDTPEGFRYLSAYSPLHTIRADAKYPAVLVTTADHDDRVHPAHSFKYAAAMQAANPQAELPVMIRIETRAGHGAGKPTSKLIEEA
ncbi:MAG TPA: prolyl oligopeptidase family serine peptidase, partial [Opitutaceae bacterium]